jgi:hypothetical protein
MWLTASTCKVKTKHRHLRLREGNTCCTLAQKSATMVLLPPPTPSSPPLQTPGTQRTVDTTTHTDRPTPPPSSANPTLQPCNPAQPRSSATHADRRRAQSPLPPRAAHKRTVDARSTQPRPALPRPLNYDSEASTHGVVPVAEVQSKNKATIPAGHRSDVGEKVRAGDSVPASPHNQCQAQAAMGTHKKPQRPERATLGG